jgi:hypothetical protein
VGNLNLKEFFEFEKNVSMMLLLLLLLIREQLDEGTTKRERQHEITTDS